MRNYCETQHGQIHYWEEGSGEAVVLLHQLPLSGRMFSRMMPLLADRYRLIAPDIPGFGNSDKPPPGFTVSDLAECMVQLLDSLNISKARVFGVHSGAVIAAEMAARWPQRVGSAVLGGFPYVNAEEREQRMRSIKEQTEGLPGALPFVVPQGDGSHFANLWHRAYRRIWWGQERIPDPELSPHDLEFANYVVMVSMASWETTPSAFKAVFSYDTEGSLPAIKAPTMFMHVTGPHEREPSKRSEALASLIPGSKVAALEGGDAFFVYWKAEEVCEVVRQFWK